MGLTRRPAPLGWTLRPRNVSRAQVSSADAQVHEPSRLVGVVLVLGDGKPLSEVDDVLDEHVNLHLARATHGVGVELPARERVRPDEPLLLQLALVREIAGACYERRRHGDSNRRIEREQGCSLHLWREHPRVRGQLPNARER